MCQRFRSSGLFDKKLKFVVCSEYLSPTSQTHAEYNAFSHTRNTQQGSAREGGSSVGPRVDLPLHCYLLLRHKGAPWRATSGRKARRRMSQLELHREEDPRLSSMTTLSSMNTIYATGSLFSNRPPCSPFFASRSCHIHRDLSGLLCSASSFSFSISQLFFFTGKIKGDAPQALQIDYGAEHLLHDSWGSAWWRCEREGAC